MRLRTACSLTVGFLGVFVCLALPLGAWAAENAGDRWGAWLEIGKFANLVLVVAVLVGVARKPIAIFFAGRSKAIRDQLEEAQRARQEAETKLGEIDLRMSRLDDELREIRAAAEREAQEEQRRLIAAAERDAERIVEGARREVDAMTRAARLELKAHVAELSVQLAKAKIRDEITDDDRNRLFARFVAKVGGRE